MKLFTFPAVSLAVAIFAAAALSPGTARSAPDPCDGLSGAAKGLCQAYCRAQDCPAGHNGSSCASLRKNWQKQTGEVLFPCDAVCCECANGARACSTLKRCRQATECAVVARCVDGKCPATPVPTATPTPTPAPPPECPCEAICTDASGVVGSCKPVDPDDPTDCRCVAQTPTPACPCGANCIDADGNDGSCRPDAANPDVCTCVQIPTPTPPPACPCEATCTTTTGNVGTCQVVAGSTVCECVQNPPAPCGLDPATNQCGGACPIAGEECTACTAAACPAPCVCAAPNPPG